MRSEMAAELGILPPSSSVVTQIYRLCPFPRHTYRLSVPSASSWEDLFASDIKTNLQGRKGGVR